MWFCAFFGTLCRKCSQKGASPLSPIEQEPTVEATYSGECPKCDTVGGACTSGNLLNSRGAMGTPEPNGANNAMGGCRDGDAGTYHSDESIDAITVKAANGGYLRVGREAVIEATVWAYNDGSSDTADFFVAEDAENPDWRHIGSVVPSAGGEQVLTSPKFTLTTERQAVRVVFRYAGEVSDTACSGGNWDDNDDLAFAVLAADGDATTPSPTASPTRAPTSSPTTEPTREVRSFILLLHIFVLVRRGS